MRAPTDAIRRRTTDVAWAAGGLGGMLVAGSAALAFILFAYLPGRWRWVPLLVTVVVSAGRLYVGAHFPLDVVGGACLGIAAGALATFVGGVPARPVPRTTADDPGDRSVP